MHANDTLLQHDLLRLINEGYMSLTLEKSRLCFILSSNFVHTLHFIRLTFPGLLFSCFSHKKALDAAKPSTIHFFNVVVLAFFQKFFSWKIC